MCGTATGLVGQGGVGLRSGARAGAGETWPARGLKEVGIWGSVAKGDGGLRLSNRRTARRLPLPFSCLHIGCCCCSCCPCTRAGEKGGKAAAKGGKGDVAPALPLETALRKLRQEHAEGMCSISQVGGVDRGTGPRAVWQLTLLTVIWGRASAAVVRYKSVGFAISRLLTLYPAASLQAMDLMSAGRAARGNRSTTSPRRGARGSQGGQQQQQQQLGPGGEGGAGGRAGGGIMWADGAGDGVGLTLIEDDLEGV